MRRRHGGELSRHEIVYGAAPAKGAGAVKAAPISVICPWCGAGRSLDHQTKCKRHHERRQQNTHRRQLNVQREAERELKQLDRLMQQAPKGPDEKWDQA